MHLKGVASKARRLWLSLGAGLVLALLVVRPLLAADLTGTWDISCWIGQDHQTITLELAQDGRSVSGAGTVWFDDSRDSVLVEVRSGTVHGVDFRLSVARVGGAALPPQEFFGSWYRNEMSGRTDGAFGRRVFSGSRR